MIQRHRKFKNFKDLFENSNNIKETKFNSINFNSYMTEIHFNTLTYSMCYVNGIQLSIFLRNYIANHNENWKNYNILKYSLGYLVFHVLFYTFSIYKNFFNHYFFAFEQFILSIVLTLIIFGLFVNEYIRIFEKILKNFRKIYFITYLYRFYLFLHIKTLVGIYISKYYYFILMLPPFSFLLNFLIKIE